MDTSTFRIEVAGALVRRGLQVQQTRRLIEPLCALPHEIVTRGPKRVALAEALAIKARLRGPDALYVWLASSCGLPLCTLDREMAERARAFCKVIAPRPIRGGAFLAPWPCAWAIASARCPELRRSARGLT
jgi:predicted nucleic acid-binding protein